MTKCYDLHCHSTASDGLLTPSELVYRAAQQQVDVLALTDHDTVSGLQEAYSAAQAHNIELVPGIECSALWARRTVHVLGLNIDPANSALQQAQEQLQQLREERAERIARRLAKVGLQDALAGARAHAGEGAIARPHFAAHMVEAGFVKSTAQAFKRYLGNGKIGDVANAWPSLTESVATILNAGGIPVLAHPDKYNLTRTKLRALVSDFVAAGGRGLEVVNGYQDNAVTQRLVALCTEYQLLGSSGSDFHVPSQPWQELGRQSLLPTEVQPVWDVF